MIKQIKINSIIKEAEGISYEFPVSEQIIIRKSDLQIQLEKFKTRILSTFSIFDLLAIASLWSPVLGADFKSIFGIKSIEIQAGYVVFAILITIFILCSRAKYFIINFSKKTKNSSDSEKMAENILAQCNSKTKNN